MTIYYDKVGTLSYRDKYFSMDVDMRVRKIALMRRGCKQDWIPSCMFASHKNGICSNCGERLTVRERVVYKVYMVFDRRVDPIEFLKGYNVAKGGPLLTHRDIGVGSTPGAPLSMRGFVSKKGDPTWRPQRKEVFRIFETYEQLEKFLKSIYANTVKQRKRSQNNEKKGKIINAQKVHREEVKWTLHKIPSQDELEQAFKKWEMRRMIDRM